MKTLLTIICVLWATTCFAGDVSLRWDEAAGADTYDIQISSDLGTTWTVVPGGNDITGTTVTVQGVADTGLMLFRVKAQNTQGETIRTDAGVWYNGVWKRPGAATNIGVN